jgi:hypothetical protein
MKLANTEWDKFKNANKLNFEELFAQKNSNAYRMIKNSLLEGIDYSKGNENFYEEQIKDMFINQEKFKLQILKTKELDIDEFEKCSIELNKYNF